MTQSTHVFPENIGPRMSWRKDHCSIRTHSSDPPQQMPITIWLSLAIICYLDLATGSGYNGTTRSGSYARHRRLRTGGKALQIYHCFEHSRLWSHKFPRLFNREGVGNQATNQNLVAMVVSTLETFLPNRAHQSVHELWLKAEKQLLWLSKRKRKKGHKKKR